MLLGCCWVGSGLVVFAFRRKEGQTPQSSPKQPKAAKAAQSSPKQPKAAQRSPKHSNIHPRIFIAARRSCFGFLLACSGLLLACSGRLWGCSGPLWGSSGAAPAGVGLLLGWFGAGCFCIPSKRRPDPPKQPKAAQSSDFRRKESQIPQNQPKAAQSTEVRRKESQARPPKAAHSSPKH